jgi:hypothetical protein
LDESEHESQNDEENGWVVFMKMKFKEWLNYEFPFDEIIAGGSSVCGGDLPVKHPIGIAPQSLKKFDTNLIKSHKNINELLCYQNVRKFAGGGTRRRKKLLKHINRHNFITRDGWTINRHKVVDFNTFFESLLKHKFCISPEGNGIDCHRHYETILAKGIPIVNKPNEEYSNKRWGTNSFMEKYDNLPVLWTSNYKELSIEYLNDKYDEFMETEFDFAVMTKYYWQKKSPNFEECTNYWMEKFK